MTLSKDIPPCERHCHGGTRLNPGRQILDVDADDQPLEFPGHAVVSNEKCGRIFSWNVPLLKTRMLNRSTCHACKSCLQVGVGTLSEHSGKFHRSFSVGPNEHEFPS